MKNISLRRPHVNNYKLHCNQVICFKTIKTVYQRILLASSLLCGHRLSSLHVFWMSARIRLLEHTTKYTLLCRSIQTSVFWPTTWWQWNLQVWIQPGWSAGFHWRFRCLGVDYQIEYCVWLAGYYHVTIHRMKTPCINYFYIYIVYESYMNTFFKRMSLKFLF